MQSRCVGRGHAYRQMLIDASAGSWHQWPRIASVSIWRTKLQSVFLEEDTEWLTLSMLAPPSNLLGGFCQDEDTRGKGQRIHPHLSQPHRLVHDLGQPVSASECGAIGEQYA